MRIAKRILVTALSSFVLLTMLAATSVVFNASIAHAARGITGTTRTITLGGTGSPQIGSFTPSGAHDVSQDEFSNESDDGNVVTPYPGMITSPSTANGGTAGSVTSAPKAKSNPIVNTSFDGVNHYQSRYTRGGNQFSLEPPDQGLCAGNGQVVEVVNDAFNVYNSSGNSLLPDNTATNIVSGLPRNVGHTIDLNSFFGYAPSINRSTGVRGPEVTDPSCLFDAATQRYFLVVLTLEQFPGGGFTTVNHLDLAVSKTASATGAWNIYHIDVTSDGTNTGGVNPGPYLGDYPHMGADANGIYLTTNAYPWFSNGFSGAQVYAMSKAALAAGASTVTVVHFDTSGAVNVPSDAGSTQPGFTVWPAQSPGTGGFDSDNGGTEFFMSSNAADEAQMPVSGNAGTRTSNQIIVWSMTNTASLNSSSALTLSNQVLSANRYARPPATQQPGTGTAPTSAVPQGFCLNDTTTVTIAGTGCWKLLVSPVAHTASGLETITQIDSNDTRMQQVTYANGNLWGALDTALNPDGGAQRAGIAYFIVNPNAGKMVKQGYLGAAGHDFTYPAIGVAASGRGVMAFTDTGDTTFPSAAYAAIDAQVGVNAWNDIALGAAADDGFSGYKAQNFPNPKRPRWGDYGAAAVVGNSIWIASEYIARSCDYTTWGGPFFAGGTGDNLLGSCAGTLGGVGTRTALANWATRISMLTP
jgi:hypothetical protein